ncbi:tyrosine-protein phosphatase, partial [Acinetobacter soli]|uniref:tyrosine-protein phosphatase n=1 Tax=Acinetobacter soli TaxID=487316 RepID=UPI002812AF9C
LRGTKEAAALPDYVPDGARLVRLSGLCDEDGREMSFAPPDIARLLNGQPDTGFNAVQAVYRRMLSGNRAFRELFRALEAGETPILFHCSAGK